MDLVKGYMLEALHLSPSNSADSVDIQEDDDPVSGTARYPDRLWSSGDADEVNSLSASFNGQSAGRPEMPTAEEVDSLQFSGDEPPLNSSADPGGRHSWDAPSDNILTLPVCGAARGPRTPAGLPPLELSAFQRSSGSGYLPALYPMNELIFPVGPTPRPTPKHCLLRLRQLSQPRRLPQAHKLRNAKAMTAAQLIALRDLPPPRPRQPRPSVLLTLRALQGMPFRSPIITHTINPVDRTPEVPRK